MSKHSNYRSDASSKVKLHGLHPCNGVTVSAICFAISAHSFVFDINLFWLNADVCGYLESWDLQNNRQLHICTIAFANKD